MTTKYCSIIFLTLSFCFGFSATAADEVSNKTSTESKDFYRKQTDPKTYFDLKGNKPKKKKDDANKDKPKAVSSTYKIRLPLSDTKISFLAIGNPNAIKIRGKSSMKRPLIGELIVNKSKIIGKAAFNLDSLKTGISLRDRHLKEKYLETAKWRYAQFKFTDFHFPTILTSKEANLTDLPFIGEMILHGVKKPVEGVANFSRDDDEVTLKFNFEIRLSDFAIATPSYLGVTVAERVKITVDVESTLLPFDTEKVQENAGSTKNESSREITNKPLPKKQIKK